jgi:hypothetical protein
MLRYFWASQECYDTALTYSASQNQPNVNPSKLICLPLDEMTTKENFDSLTALIKVTVNNDGIMNTLINAVIYRNEQVNVWATVFPLSSGVKRAWIRNPVMCHMATRRRLWNSYCVCLAAMHQLKEYPLGWITSVLNASLNFMWTDTTKTILAV